MPGRETNILEFPSNLGLKAMQPQTEPGVKKLPDWLRKHGFHRQLNPQQTLRLNPPAYSMEVDEESGVRNANRIVRYALEQASLLNKVMEHSNLQIIIGGDCSILIGNALALKQQGNFGLFFLDGHTDYMLPKYSQTEGAAGMDLAIVTGHGHDKLTNINNQKPYFGEKHVFCVGNREYDPGYVQLILDSEIEYFDLKALRSTGLEKVSRAFLKMVEKYRLDGFLIHLDVDVLNDNIMPAVDSRQEDGLSYVELSELLVPLLLSDKAFGIEITILDPDLDKEGRYTDLFVRHFVEIVKTAMVNA